MVSLSVGVCQNVNRRRNVHARLTFVPRRTMVDVRLLPRDRWLATLDVLLGQYHEVPVETTPAFAIIPGGRSIQPARRKAHSLAGWVRSAICPGRGNHGDAPACNEDHCTQRYALRRSRRALHFPVAARTGSMGYSSHRAHRPAAHPRRRSRPLSWKTPHCLGGSH